MARLLILACSQRKSEARQLMPAVERYDGPAFRVLRKYLREATVNAPTVLILSAKYGLTAAGRKIPSYDVRMTPATARVLRPQVLKAARRQIASGVWQSVGICAGKDYQPALEGLPELIPEGTRVDKIRGGQGVRLTALRDWLRQST